MEQAVTVGNHILNAQLFIIDRNFLPFPIGAAGELLIGGEGVGIGYINDVQRTDEKFVTLSPGEDLAARLYRTGDLAKCLPDGNIEFLGRIDHQVKIQAFRIEPGEIDNCLVKHRQIKEAVVITGNNPGE